MAGDSLLWVSSGEQSEPFAGAVTGAPQHLVAVVTAADLTLYLDGESLGTVIAEPFDDSRSSALRFGSLNSLFGFRGILDDAQLYNGVLNAEEAAFLSQNPGATLVGEDPVGVTVASLRRTADGAEIDWLEEAGLRYTVQHSETLLPDSWQDVVTDAKPPFSDSAAERVGRGAGYYRIGAERE